VRTLQAYNGDVIVYFTTTTDVGYETRHNGKTNIVVEPCK